MIRKLFTILATVVVALGALPVMSAFAADSTAALTSPRNLFADGGVRDFSIDVTNTNAGSPGTLGLGGTPGASIHFINVTIPTNMTDVACNLQGTAASEFGCQVRVQRSGQSLLVLESTGDGLAAASTLDIDFQAKIVRPAGVERTDTYQVRTGTDGNDFDLASGPNLSQTVRGLELGSVITIDDLRTDAEVLTRFTSNQELQALVDVTNHATADINVTGTISGAPNSPAQAVQSVPAGETRTLVFDIDTAGTTNNFNNYDLTVSATGASASSGINTSQTGDAVRISNGNTNTVTDPKQIRVEAEAALAFNANAKDTLEVNGDNDTTLVGPGPTVITIDARKSQIPRVDLAAHNNNGTPTNPADDTGSYAVFTIDCLAAPCPQVVGSLAAVNGTSRTLPQTGAGGADVELTYQVDFSLYPALAAGQRYNIDVEFFFTGVDHNQYDFDADLSLDNLLLIDLEAPVLEITELVGNVLDGRVKDGDIARVSGNVTHTDDLESLEITLNASTAGTSGDTYNTVAVTEANLSPATNNGDGTYTQTFTVNVPLPGDANNSAGEASHVLGKAGTLTASGSATDEAGTPGIAAPRSISVDNDHPDLTPVVPYLVDGTLEDRALGFYIQDNAYGPENVVRVVWDAGTFTDTVDGGCTASDWTVEGVSVVEVRYFDNSTCTVGGSAPSNFDPATAPRGSSINDRILVLDGPVDFSNGTVEYSYETTVDSGVFGIGGTDPSPVTDDIANEAYAQAGVVIDDLTPNLPSIVAVDRLDLVANDGTREPAGVSPDADSFANSLNLYHSNTADLTALIAGTGNYNPNTDVLEVVEITDTANFDPFDPAANTFTAIDSHSPNGDDQFDLDAADLDFTSCGTNCQARQPRAIRFLRTVQVGANQFEINEGPFLRFDLLFDSQVLQALNAGLTVDDGGPDTGSIEFNGASAITANAGNTVVGFYARADEWAVESTLGDGSSNTDYALHIGESVTLVDNTVDFSIDYTAEEADFFGNSYFKLSFGGQIEDLAGNLMADSYRVEPGGALETF